MVLVTWRWISAVAVISISISISISFLWQSEKWVETIGKLGFQLDGRMEGWRDGRMGQMGESSEELIHE
jgi:hypothetical protein